MPYKKGLSTEERLEMVALLETLEERGLPLPPEIDPRQNKKMVLPLNGFFPKRDGTLYTPTKTHLDFIESKARFSLFYGSRGSGKSSAGTQKALRKIQQGLSGAVINPSFENFRTSTWDEFRSWIPWRDVVPNQRYRASRHWNPTRPFKLVFNNGATVICKGLRDPDSARGSNINWLWYDEGGSDETGMAWNLAVASVRVGLDPQAWVTTTPNGIDHWLHQFFILKEIPEEALKIFEESGQPLIDVFHGTIEENKSNLDPMFYASLIAVYSNQGWLYEQEIKGRFVRREGALGNRAWFDGKILNRLPDIGIKKRVRYWDLAATEKKMTGRRNDPDESVGTRMVFGSDLNFYIEHQIGGHWEFDGLLDGIFTTALQDGISVPIFLEEEPGSGGKNQVAAIKKHLNKECDKRGLPRFQVYGYRPVNDRVILANIWFAEASKGRFYLIKGDWNSHFLNQISSFPIGAHDDTITSVSGARMNVAPIQSFKQINFLHL